MESTAFRLRPADESDYSFYSFIFPTLGEGRSAIAKSEWMTCDMSRAQIVELDDQKVGYICGLRMKTLYYLMYFIISEKYRNKGIGNRAFAAFVEQLKSEQLERLGLHCDIMNQVAYRLYTKFGMMRQVRKLTYWKIPWTDIQSCSSQYSVKVIHDPKGWNEMETSFDLNKGKIESFTSMVNILTIAAFDPVDTLKGLGLFNATDGKVYRLVVFDQQALKALLSYIGSLSNSQVSSSLDVYLDPMMEDGMECFQGATLCEQYDYLECKLF